MYVIRRTAKAQPGKVWQVANLLIKICAAYEENGRPKAQVYVSQDLPGTPNVAYAEWTQATIEPNWPSQVPEVFGSERLTRALLDRLTHHVHILEMNGDSYRLRHSR